MKPSHPLVFVLLLSFLTLPSTAAELRVLTYNIHHGEGVDGELDLERIAKVIRSVSPDLVALNEVDNGVDRSQRVDQPVLLAKLTEMEVLFEKNIDHEGGEYGNAILSRLPILRHKNFALPSLYEGEQRGILVAEAKLPDESHVWFSAAHLDYRPPDAERLQSFKFISDLFAARYSDHPAILAGDFNSTPESRVMKQFREEWTVVPTELTSPAAKPVKTIDYVMYRGAKSWRVVETRVLEEPVASDHRPVLVVFEIGE